MTKKAGNNDDGNRRACRQCEPAKQFGILSTGAQRRHLLTDTRDVSTTLHFGRHDGHVYREPSPL
ncbi:MAG: hypothetical protein LBT42_08185, partial [Tannerella sp.]|nr:hypothetical protein [Tannerella sp.]